MLAKIERLVVENFSGVIFSFVVFWLGLVAIGLLSQ